MKSVKWGSDDTIFDGIPISIGSFGEGLVAISLGVLFLQFLILPFYINVFRKNRKRDEKTPLYPLFSYIFYFSLVFYFFFGLSILIVIATIIVYAVTHTFPYVVGFIFATIYPLFFFMREQIKVFHLLLFLAAVQRFLIYFFPETESYCNRANKHFKGLMYFINFLVVVQDVYQFFTHSALSNFSFPNLTHILALLLFTAAILHIPIYRSVRKLGHLASARLSKPQIFIFWQTLAIAIGLVLGLLSQIGIYQEDQMYYLLSFGDIIMIPFIIQVTYLGCNRRNLDSLLNSIPIWIKWIVCCKSETSQVAPAQTPLYPLLNYIFHSLLVFCILLGIFIVCFIATLIIFVVLKTNHVWVIIFCVSVLSFFFMREQIKVFHLLLFLVAVQRFLIYFFPETESYCNRANKHFKGFMVFINCSVVFQEVYHLNKYNGVTNFSFPNLYQILTLLLFTAAILHIPIYLSVRKLGNIASARLNKPQIFIFWQTLAMVMGKMLYISLSFIDILMIPFIIQVTYLGCNKRNLDSLLNPFKSMPVWMVCCKSETSQVTPSQALSTIYRGGLQN
ncbi:hypothetical protein CRE_17954 [Caenorhabditis remanei]|uniref:Uncharacterized protein n=1 Tax=Caenorhabditis remanei TaxID=31234 RepID=E3MDR3_CAERE|nr:hypothetical protein CRE_17954 [Caenorhabditis remanei]